MKVSISGGLLSSILNEGNINEDSSYGILYGIYQMKIRQNTTDTNENNNYTESYLGVSHYLGTKQDMPFVKEGKIQILSSLNDYNISNEEFQNIVGLFTVRRTNTTLAPSFRDVETLIELNQLKICKHPLIILIISVPIIVEKPTWIYPIEYNCYTVTINESNPFQNPIVNPIDIFIPSLSPDINLEYRSIESSLPFPSNQISNHNPHSQFKQQYQNIFFDSILSTINTELLADSYLQEIQNELVKVESLQREIDKLKALKNENL